MARWSPALLLGALVLAGAGTGAGALADLLLGPLPFAGLEHVTRIAHGSGAGLWVHEGYAYSSALGSGFFITDIRDPGQPAKVAQLTGLSARDADILLVGGRTIATLAQGNNNIHFVDVTDPTQPVLLRTFNTGATVHNLAALRGTPYVYGSRGGGGVGPLDIDIIDASDPANPSKVKVWTAAEGPLGEPILGSSCNDVTVFPDVGRAYCAGGRQSFVLDITDPLEPAIVSVISNPLNTLHHTAMPNRDHTVLILGDEALGTAMPACLASATTPAATLSAPTGALWFYDITIPEAPVLLSWLSPPTFPGTPCTAHFGTLVGDLDVLALGWYRAGVLLVDFRLPAAPRIVDQWTVGDASVWDVQYHDGYLFTGDLGTGMDVLRLV